MNRPMLTRSAGSFARLNLRLGRGNDGPEKNQVFPLGKLSAPELADHGRRDACLVKGRSNPCTPTMAKGAFVECLGRQGVGQVGDNLDLCRAPALQRPDLIIQPVSGARRACTIASTVAQSRPSRSRRPRVISTSSARWISPRA